MAAGGIGIASAADDYKTWRVVNGPAHVPDAPSGSGLPAALVNALLVAHDGSIYAGTTCGLAGSQDGGKTWHFLRGADWFDKARDRVGGAAPELTGPAGELLSEDWVTCLAEDGSGALWIGHRRTGVERFDPAAGQHTPLPPLPPTDFVRAVLATDAQNPWVGTYGKGLLQPAALPSGGTVAAAAPPLPSPAPAPDAATLTALAQDAAKLTTPLAPDTGEFLGDDWATQGDWVGRYGRQYAALCAMQGGGDHIYAEDLRYSVSYGIGPHHKGYNGVYTYVGKLFTTDRRLPYTPVRGSRRDAEVNDGSWDQGTYPASYEGPDVWVTVTVPDGLHRVSLYLVNNDGHDGDNRRRDYTVELRPHKDPVANSQAQPPLASTRVSNFYDGVYTQFLVQGPGAFDFKIGRDYSACTKLQGVFCDRLTGTVPPDAPKPPSIAEPYLGLILAPGPNGTVFVSNLDGVGPSGKAGVQPGDVILRAGGKLVTGVSGLMAQIGRTGAEHDLLGARPPRRPRRHARHPDRRRHEVTGRQFLPMTLPLGGVQYDPPTATCPRTPPPPWRRPRRCGRRWSRRRAAGGAAPTQRTASSPTAPPRCRRPAVPAGELALDPAPVDARRPPEAGPGDVPRLAGPARPDAEPGRRMATARTARKGVCPRPITCHRKNRAPEKRHPRRLAQQCHSARRGDATPLRHQGEGHHADPVAERISRGVTRKACIIPFPTMCGATLCGCPSSTAWPPCLMASADHGEAGEFARGVVPGGRDFGDLGGVGPALERGQELVQRRLVALGDGLDAAVRRVADGAGEAELFGDVVGVVAEANPLHPARHAGLNALGHRKAPFYWFSVTLVILSPCR